jgi:pyroglutamyl-peptidase
MKKILLTGFKPFLGESINPSEKLVMSLQNQYSTLILPVVFEESWRLVREEIATKSYDIVVMFGQAGGRAKVSLERYAVNLIDSEYADENNQKHLEAPIIPNAPAAYQTSISLRGLSCLKNGVNGDVEISNSAGTFVCNYLYFQLLHGIQEKELNMQGLFVHLPYLPEQIIGKEAQVPSMSFEKMKTTVQNILRDLDI